MSILTDVRTLLIFLITFTVIIAVHEFGHYLTARLLGMKVIEFAFGFPPRLFALRKGGIDYSVNAIPFGGFVRILGQDDFAIRQQGEGEPGSFTSKPWWMQAIVLVAGVAMNMVLALVVLTAAFGLGTLAPTGDVRIIEVKAGSPAEDAGVRQDDVITELDGRRFSDSRGIVEYSYRAAGVQRASGQPVRPQRDPVPVTLTLKRPSGQIAVVMITPRQILPEGEGPLGIVLEDVTAPVSVSLPEAFASAVALTGDILEQIAALPGQLLADRGAPGGGPQIGGPIEIARITGQVSQFGVAAVLRLVGVLSINLAVLNIIPFPALDGGRLLFVLIGGIFRRRLSPQLEAAIHAVGFVVLLGLLVLVSIADIRRAFGG